MSSPAAFATLAKLHQQMADVYAELAAEVPAPQADRVVGLAEAAVRLGCSRAWLSRRANWERCGGYRDLDSRIKFSMAALEAYVRALEQWVRRKKGGRT